MSLKVRTKAAVMMNGSVQDDKNGNICFGVCNLHIGSDEDSFSCNLSHGDDNVDNLSSFGVFDGHNGVKAAEHCALVMHKIVALNYHRLQKAYETIRRNDLTQDISSLLEEEAPLSTMHTLREDEKRDAMLCEALRSSSLYLDKKLQSTTFSGTTMSSLFCEYNPEDKSMRVMCSNIGDSRTVMITCDEFDEIIALSDIGMQPGDIDSKMSILTPISMSSSISSEKKTSSLSSSKRPYTLEGDDITVCSRDQCKEEDEFSRNPSDSRKVRLSKLFSMSEDHSLHLERERNRVINKKNISFLPFPINSDSYGAAQAADTFINRIVDRLCDLSPEEGRLFKVFKSEELNDVDLEEFSSLRMYDDIVASGNKVSRTGKSVENNFQLVRSESFVARRKGESGLVGPEAIFSRYNVSVMMTRSLGDRYGPRACQGIPDIKSVTIAHNQHARFVIASDGLWDVMTSDYIRCNGLRKKYIDPKTFASALAQKAKRERENRGLRMDDITVIVVDINGGPCEETSSKFKVVNSKTGSDIVVNGKSISKGQCAVS